MQFARFSLVWGKPNMTPRQRYEPLWREMRSIPLVIENVMPALRDYEPF